MIKLLIFLISFYSMKAAASYRCNLKLSHVDNLDQTLIEKSLKASDSDMHSTIESLESQKLFLNHFITGWKGEEEATFVISKNNEDKSEKIELRGNDHETLWYDSYRLEASCEIK